MNVIKTKIISLKLAKSGSKERLDVPLPTEGGRKISYGRRFSVPYGQAVESWKEENNLTSCPEEEEYPIYQSASFKRYRINILFFNRFWRAKHKIDRKDQTSWEYILISV